MAEGKFISYLRVSTAKQGASGLGLEAQRKAVTDYLNGGRWSLIQEVVEVESGKRSDGRSWQRLYAFAASTVPRWSLRNWTACPAMQPFCSTSKRQACASSQPICPRQTNWWWASWP